MLAYSYISHEDDLARNLIDKGEYQFVVKNVEAKKTKSGLNNQLVVTLSVWDINNKEHNVLDWIMLDMEKFEWKFRHFCDAIGIIHLYENKSVSVEDIRNKGGYVKIGIKDGDNGRKFNTVVDYIKSATPPSRLMPLGQQKNSSLDDDIPF
jgi:hypothetical protein